ncbi:ABC transporter permease [Candidatus Bathyarchaeota archaeon]|nr:MAG: ABC transporter permease [Candidatus Bathyarchaeota archaeon]
MSTMSSTKYYMSTLAKIFKFTLKSKKLAVGVTIILFFIILGLFAEVIAPGNPSVPMQFQMDLPPSPDHPLGTDTLGRDVFDQIVHGIRQSLLIGFMAGAFGTGMGTLIGLISGYKGGYVDDILRTFTDIFLVIPTWPLLVVISSYIKQGLTIPVLAALLSVFAWPWPARTIRSQTMSLKQRDFINIAKISGSNDLEIIFKEIMPNMLSFVGANFANAVSGSILAEVGLEIVGLGPQNITTLGLIVYWAMWRGAMIRGIWWWVFPPIICITLIFIGFHLINMGLDELYNPRLRK